MPQSRIYTELQFQNLMQKLYPEQMGTFSGYRYALTIIYTFGKDIAWSFMQKTGHVLGAISDSWIDKNRKLLVGGGVIDIRAIIAEQQAGKMSIAINLPGPSSPKGSRLVLSPPSLTDIRLGVLRTLAHEFFHLIQNWHYLDAVSMHAPKRALKSELPRKAYSAVYQDLISRLKKQHPQWDDSLLDGTAHHRHPQEKDAELNARHKIDRIFRAEIDRGGWNNYLPMNDIEQELRLLTSRVLK